MATAARYTITLRADDIIYVEKYGQQTVALMHQLFIEIAALAATLRANSKPVLIPSNIEHEEPMSDEVRDMVIPRSRQLDFDKSASYTSSEYVHNLRDLLARVNKVETKVATFDTQSEALAWLQL